MPILDQGYQHWNGKLAGHACALADHHPARRPRPAQEPVGLVSLLRGALLPGARSSSVFLMLWGLFEQKSSFLTPFLFLFQGLPEELRAGPRGYRTEFWTIAFSMFSRYRSSFLPCSWYSWSDPS